MSIHEQTAYAQALTAPLLTVNDVGRLLSVSRDSVYKLVRAGHLHPVRVGERLRFRHEDVGAYLDRGASP